MLMFLVPLKKFFHNLYIKIPSNLSTVVPGFRALGFRALPGFRAQNPGDGAWSVNKKLFGFRAPLF